MHTRELSVFIENKAGRLAEVTDLLGKSDINILGFSVADMSDYGIVRLIVSEPDGAVQLLRRNNFVLRESEVLCVRVPDRPGGLAGVLKTLSAAGINVEYLYAIVKTLIAFSVEMPDEAERVLSRHGVQVLPGEEVYRL